MNYKANIDELIKGTELSLEYSAHQLERLELSRQSLMESLARSREICAEFSEIKEQAEYEV